MSITASMVKELRERTGAGMMECKKALVETNGDMDAAAEFLRKSGQAKAVKKASRVAADGRIVIAMNGGNAVMVEVNSETDFVAKDENFIAFAEAVAASALASGASDVEAFSGDQLADGRSVEEARTELISKVGENIGVRRIEQIKADGVIASYSHGARIGTVVALNGGDEALARDVAMHVAAMNPQYVSEADVPADTLERFDRAGPGLGQARGDHRKDGDGSRQQVSEGNHVARPAVRQGRQRHGRQAARRRRRHDYGVRALRGGRGCREEK